MANLAVLIVLVVSHPTSTLTTLRWLALAVPTDAECLLQQLSACFGDVANWMNAKKLQLNPAKTEFMWSHSAHWACSAGLLSVNDITITPSSTVSFLGIINTTLLMHMHVDSLVTKCLQSTDTVVTSVFCLSVCHHTCYSDTSGVIGHQSVRLLQQSTLRFTSYSSTAFSQFWTLLHDSSTIFVVATTSLLLSFVSTGSVFLSVSSSNWQFWCMTPSTAPLQLTYCHSVLVLSLLIPHYHCFTTGSRSLFISGATVWNGLPADATSSSPS